MTTQSFLIANDPTLAAAHAILTQLGGGRFRRMTQAHGFIACAGGSDSEPWPWLQMQLSPAIGRGVGGRVGRQRLRITDRGHGYTMEFYNPGPQGEKQQLLTLDHVLPAEAAAMFTYATGFFTPGQPVLSAADWLAWLRRAGGGLEVPAHRRALALSLLGGPPRVSPGTARPAAQSLALVLA